MLAGVQQFTIPRFASSSILSMIFIISSVEIALFYSEFTSISSFIVIDVLKPLLLERPLTLDEELWISSPSYFRMYPLLSLLSLLILLPCRLPSSLYGLLQACRSTSTDLQGSCLGLVNSSTMLCLKPEVYVVWPNLAFWQASIYLLEVSSSISNFLIWSLSFLTSEPCSAVTSFRTVGDVLAFSRFSFKVLIFLSQSSTKRCLASQKVCWDVSDDLLTLSISLFFSLSLFSIIFFIFFSYSSISLFL